MTRPTISWYNITHRCYRGYYYSTALGLYYLKSRFYDAEIGRFICADSLDYLDPHTVGGLNLFAYCNNNPVMNVDPTGHAWWEWAVAAVVVVACVVGAVVTGGTSLAGAAMIGAAISGTVSIGTQAATAIENGTDDFSLTQFAVDTGLGAISGALGATGISRAASTVVNSAIGATSSISSQLVEGATVDWVKVGMGATFGGLAGAIGGAGIRNTKELYKNNSVEKAFQSVNNVLARQHTGYYSSSRYAQAALTKTANRLGAAITKVQRISIAKALSVGGAGSALYNTLSFIWR